MNKQLKDDLKAIGNMLVEILKAIPGRYKEKEGD